MKAIIKYKEVLTERVAKTSYTGDNLTKEKMVDFFGLNNPDVEWYEVTIENN